MSDLRPCTRCNGSGTEPEQPGMAAIRAYMTAKGWEPDPFRGSAGAIWHLDGYPLEIGVFFEGEPGSLECRSVIKRLGWAEGRGEPEITAAIIEHERAAAPAPGASGEDGNGVV